MSSHVKHADPQSRRFDISLLTEALEREIGPQVQKQGGEIWLADVLPGRLLVQLEAPEGGGESTRRSVQAALLLLFDGDEGAFELQ